MKKSTIHSTERTVGFLLFIAVCLWTALPCQAAEGARWTEAQAKAWYEKQPWLVGCNFSPSTAINQLEMWQSETFDIKTIDRELGWAENLGFNCIRVFIHDIPWWQNSADLTSRMEEFLSRAKAHNIKVMFVLFDSCWHPYPKAGPQPAPTPHVHNSGWVQCPGLLVLTNTTRHAALEPFVKGVISRFSSHPQVLAWDLFNEPDNTNGSSYSQYEPTNKAELAYALLQKAFQWAREINPSQPLTAGVWAGEWAPDAKRSPVNRFMLENSDIITFHNYGPLPDMRKRVQSLQNYGRPLICTEYMARPAGSTFKYVLPWMKSQRIGAINWGFVAGKTQTIYPWDSWKKTYAAEPPVWFHDIFRKDGSAFDPKEILLLRELTGKAKESPTKF